MAKPKPGAGSWLTTYADFITLLMTFFIVLYTLTTGVDKKKFEAVVSIFQDNKGVLERNASIKEHEIPIQRQRSKNWEKFEKMVKENNLEEDVKIDILPAGVKITLGENVTFKTYSAMLASGSKKILRLIAASIEKYTNEPLEAIQVYGNTDSRPVLGTGGKFTNNWELGAGRAISVVQFLISNSNIEPKKFEAVTFGSYHPIADNTTSTGRQKNRRVEIFIKYYNINLKEDIKEIDALNSSEIKNMSHE